MRDVPLREFSPNDVHLLPSTAGYSSSAQSRPGSDVEFQAFKNSLRAEPKKLTAIKSSRVTFPSRKELKEIVYGPGDAGAGERISPIIQKTRNASPTKTWSSSESQGFMYNSLSGGHDGSGTPLKLFLPEIKTQTLVAEERTK